MIIGAMLLAGFQAGNTCSALEARLTPAVRRVEAARISTLAHQRVRPQDVGAVYNEGAWRLVFATPPEAERGVFVLRGSGRGGYRLVDTWGGVLEPGSHDAETWARARTGGGVPARLARCMNSAILAGR